MGEKKGESPKKNWYIYGNKQDDNSETKIAHAEASDGEGTKVGRYSYVNANGKEVVTHYKSTPGKGIKIMTNNLPEDTLAVKKAKEAFFAEFNKRKNLHKTNRENALKVT